MSRYRSASSYGQSIQYIAPDCYRVWWTVDRYYAGSRLRHPRSSSRNTDLAGAKRFAKRWGIEVPSPLPTQRIDRRETSE